jgi:hypothetical protein
MSLVSQINLALTRIAQEIRDVRAAAGGGAAVQPDEPVGTDEGHLWYDTDDNDGGTANWGQVQDWNVLTTYQATEPVSVVTYDGETYAAIATSTGVAPGTDVTKWIKVAAKGGASSATVADVFPENPIAGQIVIQPSAAPLQLQEPFGRLGQRVLRGGGRRIVSTGGVAWTKRFYIAGAGRRSAHAPDGYFNIVMPPIGTVIQKIGGAAGTATVTTDGSYQNTATRYVPLTAGETLWWIPPYGSVGTTAGEFVITRWPITADYDVPETWVHIVSHNIDYPATDGCSHVWGDGQQQSRWIAAALQSPWVWYGTGHGFPAWKKENGWVRWRGLIKGGSTANPRICWLGDDNADMSEDAANTVNLHLVNSDTGYSRVDTNSAQMMLVTGGGSAFLSLAPIRYWNG